MKYKFVLVLSMFVGTAQGQDQLPKQALQVVAGISNHTGGDALGVTFGTEYLKYYSNKFSLAYNIRGTIHNYKHEYFVTYAPSGRVTDASIRFTTAGVQTGVNAGFSIIRTRNHELAISLGAFGRYQSSSNGEDGYSVLYPNTTAGIPTYLFSFDNMTPQATFAVGGLLQLSYNVRVGNGYIGILPGLQTDSHGDLILQVLLTGGRRFGK
jgi:hypothetical protein